MYCCFFLNKVALVIKLKNGCVSEHHSKSFGRVPYYDLEYQGKTLYMFKALSFVNFQNVAFQVRFITDGHRYPQYVLPAINLDKQFSSR